MFRNTSNEKEKLKVKFKLGLMIILLLSLFSCGSSTSTKSDKCSNMDSYNKGFKEGRNNKMAADCDYYWELDKSQVEDKSCFCKGFRDGGGEDWMK